MGESIPPPNEKCKDYCSYLRILLYCQLIIGIFKLFVGFWDVSGTYSTGYGAITELLSCCFIYCAYAQLNYCSCIIYIFFCLFAAIEDFVIVGRELQNGNPLFNGGYSTAHNLAMAITIISFIYYCIAIYISFLAYREFKAISYEMGGILQSRADDAAGDQDDGYGGYGGYGGGYGGGGPAPQQQAAYGGLLYIFFFIKKNINVFYFFRVWC